MSEWRWWMGGLVALALMVLGGCGERGSPTSDGARRPVVVCTIGMIADVVREVAGDRAEVVGLIGAGVDPHLYKPTRSDMQRVLGADVVFYNGLMLEGKMVDSLVRAGTSGKRVYAVTELLDESYLLEPAGQAGHTDPHVWMDPRAWARAVEVVRDKLGEVDPAGRGEYARRAEEYLARLGELDAYVEKVLASVPADRRVLVTAHDAFNYFGRRYGFEVVGIQGISTESEAGVRDVERLVDLIVSRKVGAVFAESTVSERNITALIDGARARGHRVDLGGRLFSDAMGAEGTYEGTYLGMIDHNATRIARSLGGEAPERGMDGGLTP